ncbi:hypothetical protein QQF64_034074 [Cirrhinus molitorella]|uniref:Uncharacterized protein n=1 Tax=Cirrhinus molitorella TaxID=172907 RepID=A0ABR3MVT4_9TELE
MEALIRMLLQDEAHGWGHHITILITAYCVHFQVPVSLQVAGDIIEATEVVDDVDLPPPCPVRGVCSGNAWRDTLAAKVSAPQVFPVQLNEHDYLHSSEEK